MKTIITTCLCFAAFTSNATINYTYVGDTADYTKASADFPGSGDYVQINPFGDGVLFTIDSEADAGWHAEWSRYSTSNNGSAYTPKIWSDINNDLIYFNQGEDINLDDAAIGGNPMARSILEDGVTTVFSNNMTYYLPMFMEDGTDLYKGWIKIRTLGTIHQIVVESYAFNDVANGDIYAGEGAPLGLNENTSAFTNLTNPVQNELKIEVNQDCEVIVYNSNGQLISHKYLFAGENSLDFTNQPSGFYFIREELNGEIKKVIKQ